MKNPLKEIFYSQRFQEIGKKEQERGRERERERELQRYMYIYGIYVCISVMHDLQSPGVGIYPPKMPKALFLHRIMENQMEKTMENEIETRVLQGYGQKC